MSDGDDRQFRIEEQRARLQNLLRGSGMALMIVVDEDGSLVTGFMNCNQIEVVGLAKVLNDLAPNIVDLGDRT